MKIKKEEAGKSPKIQKSTSNKMAGGKKMVIQTRQKQEHMRCRTDMCMNS